MDDNDPILVAYRARQKELQERYQELHNAMQDADIPEEQRRLLAQEMGAIRDEQYARPPNVDWLEYDDCQVGFTYAIYSRNLSFGVFTGGQSGGFVGIREKFDSLFLFTEYHRDRGAMFGTVEPWRELEACPVPDLREGWSGGCSEHGRPTLYDETKPRLRESDGYEYPGTWTHTDDGSEMPQGDHSTHVSNEELFKYLEEVEKRWDWREIMNSTRYLKHPDLAM